MEEKPLDWFFVPKEEITTLDIAEAFKDNYMMVDTSWEFERNVEVENRKREHILKE